MAHHTLDFKVSSASCANMCVTYGAEYDSVTSFVWLQGKSMYHVIIIQFEMVVCRFTKKMNGLFLFFFAAFFFRQRARTR